MTGTRGRASAAVSAAAVAVVAVGAVALANAGRPSAGPSGSATTPTSAVTVDAAQGMTFTPADFPSDAGYLSADAVWQKWDHEQLPDSIPATFGKLTMFDGKPGAPGVEQVNDDTPVWAFQEQYCLGGKPLAPPTASSSGKDPSPGTCTTWTFFDPTDGHQLLSDSIPNQ
jgi:hypothetical protein